MTVDKTRGSASNATATPSSEQSRKQQVIAQYASAEAAAEYARSIKNLKPGGRGLRSRLKLVCDIIAKHNGGDLLDAGCGPGLMVNALLRTRPGEFNITALDQSAAMVRHCVASVNSVGPVNPVVGQIERLPFVNQSFDIVLVMGSLEYTDATVGIDEISRVLRHGGLVIITMLNPLSLYRVVEYVIYWPITKIVCVFRNRSVDRLGDIRYGQPTGIRTLRARRLIGALRHSGIDVHDLIYYDVTMQLPMFDRLPLLARIAARTPQYRTIARGPRRWLGTAYLVVGRRG